MMSYLTFAFLGLGAGSVYALLGLGVVLEYRGSGVVNFAHGAMGMLIAYVFVQLRVTGDLYFPVTLIPDQVSLGGPMALLPALAISIAYAMVLGVVVYGVIFRPLRGATALGKVVATIGLAIALEAVVVIQFGTIVQTTTPVVPTAPLKLATGLVVPEDHFYLAGMAIVVAVALWAIGRFTRFGLATQAAAENEKGVILLGYSPHRIAVVNWMMASVLAGASGIVFVQISGLTPATYTLLIVPALAAVLVARFRSFSGVVVAGLIIGILQSELTKVRLDWSPLPQGAEEALPFLLILVSMAVRRNVLPTRGVLLDRRLPRPGRPRRLLPGAVTGSVACATALFLLSAPYRYGLIVSLVAAVVCLSFVVLTGYLGQMSLAQLAFAGLGGFTLSHLAAGAGVGFPLDVLLAGVAAIPLGLIIGIPALRARGVSLAVVTLGAAVAVEAMVFNQTSVNGGFAGSRVPRLSLLGLDLGIHGLHSSQFPQPVFGLVILFFLLVIGLAVANLRRTATGRRMLAVRSNERAAAAAGVNVDSTKLYGFVLSAFIAGVAGGLIGYQEGVISTGSFGTFVSLSFLAVAFVGGITRVSGAIAGGLMLATGGILPTLLEREINFGKYQALVAGLLLLVAAINQPDGIAGQLDKQVVRPVRARLARSRDRPAPAAAVEANVQ